MARQRSNKATRDEEFTVEITNTKPGGTQIIDVPENEGQSPANDQGDLFKCDVSTWAIKDDMASMGFPLFSLSKQKDTKVRIYRRGAHTVRVIPSSVGAATVFDKDLLLFIASHIIEAQNRGLPTSRTVKTNSIDFLVGTERGDSAMSYDRIIDMLRRLKGTFIETNVPTGKDGTVQTEAFGIIDGYEVLSSKKRRDKDGKEIERVHSFSVRLSEWFYNGLLNFEVLTLNKAYFQLGKPIERRLYEIARKHCGEKALWKCDIDLLAYKIGTQRERRKVRDEIRQVIRADSLPEYRIALDTKADPDDVVFYTKNQAQLAMELVRSNSATWFSSLETLENIGTDSTPYIADV